MSLHHTNRCRPPDYILSGAARPPARHQRESSIYQTPHTGPCRMFAYGNCGACCPRLQMTNNAPLDLRYAGTGQGLTSRFSYGFPIFWVQLPLLLPLRFFPASVPDIPPFETASVHAPLISPIFFGDFVICGCSLGTTKKAAMECPSPPLL